ncbi:MAG: helix-turn-helix transcriptional regulator [Chloroflexi bacterium]|nr:helix-turn-helix transcriptional regulator [Chloroflexota bacterium]MDA1004411.1 helix-turn-helix transcriptional regulator [Chloroflexota bacterium]
MRDHTNPLTQQRRIGGRLRWWRKQRCLSQAELARRVGVTQSTLSHYEYGEREPKLTIFLALLEALDVEMATILGP